MQWVHRPVNRQFGACGAAVRAENAQRKTVRQVTWVLLVVLLAARVMCVAGVSLHLELCRALVTSCVAVWCSGTRLQLCVVFNSSLAAPMPGMHHEIGMHH